MAKKKEDKKQDVKQPQTNNGDAAAADLFGNSWLSPVGTPSFSRGIPAQQELLPSSQLSTPTIPSFPSPLIRTNYGLPPSERPDWRDPAMQWDARPVVPRTVEPFRGNASTEAAKKYEGLPPHLQTAVDRLNMSPQTTSVVDTARSPLSGINAPIDTSVQGMDVNRSPIATRVPEMPSGMSTAPSFDLSGATQQTTPLLTNQVPEMPVNVAQAKTPIQTPYGTVYATAQQMGNERVSEMGELPTQSARLENIGERARQSAAIKQMRERGAALNQERTDWVQNTIQQRRENPTAYTTPSGRSVAVPTNRFGQPLESWMNQLGNEGRLNYGPRPAPQTTSSTGSRSIPSPVNPSVLASTGFGAMQRAQQGSISQPLGGSPLFAGMGYTAAFGGGPQPARSMMAYNDQEDTRTRFRRTLGLV